MIGPLTQIAAAAAVAGWLAAGIQTWRLDSCQDAAIEQQAALAAEWTAKLSDQSKTHSDALLAEQARISALRRKQNEITQKVAVLEDFTVRLADSLRVVLNSMQERATDPNRLPADPGSTPEL